MRKNRFLLLLLILFSGIHVAYRGGSISYLFFYSTLLIPVLSIIYVLLVYWKFCIYQKIDMKILIKEERVPYLFQLSNEDILAYTRIRVNFMKDYSSVESMDQATEYCLLPKEEIHNETTLCCHYRGEYRVGIDYVTVRDYLNLFQFTYACDSAIEVKVLPRVVHLSSLSVALKMEDVKTLETSIRSRQEIPDVEVRRYQPSDAPRMIHWKATARQGQLLTRKYTEEPKTELVVLLDLRRLPCVEKERIIIEDKMIEALLAVTDYYVRNLSPVTVLLDADGIQRIQIYNGDDFQQLYQLCSQVRFQSTLDDHALFSYAMQFGIHHQYGLLLTATVGEELCRASYQYTSMEKELSIIYIGDDDMTEKVRAMSDRVHLYQICKTEEVQDVLERKDA